MLVHSYLYYEKDVNIISDYQWSKWARELAELQKQYPKESREVEYFHMFSAWDGSTGAFLQYNSNIISIAEHLYANYEKGKFNGNVAVKPRPIKNTPSSKRTRAKSLF